MTSRTGFDWQLADYSPRNEMVVEKSGLRRTN